MLLLLSSEGSPRYGDDIVRALAHPRGTPFQFRYGLQYLDPSLIARAKAGTLAGESVLIAFLAADAAARTTTLVSCRAASVVRSALIGSSCILTLAAGDYIHPLVDADLRSRLTPAEQALLPSWKPGGTHVDGRFVINVAATIQAGHVPKPGNEMTAFEETAAALGAHSFFGASSKLAFFAVRGLATDDDVWPEWVPSRLHRRQRTQVPFVAGRYRPISGLRYDLEVYTYSPAPRAGQAVPTKLAVASDEPTVRFVSAKQTALDSRYDLELFTFTTAEMFNALPAGLRINLEVPSGADKLEPRCDITLPVSFASRRLLGIVRMAVIAIGTAVPAMIAIKFKDQFNWPIGVVMFGGALIAGWGSVFLGKKG